MARTILQIAQEAAERDATAPAPITLFDTNTRVAKILRSAAHDVMRDYLRRSRWQGMSEMHSTWVFAFQPGRYAYSLPPDFLRMIPGTEQRNGWPIGLVGPATPQMWAWWIYGGSAAVTPHGWRIKNNVLWVDPTPDHAELIVIEYISRYPVVSTIQAGDYNLLTSPLQTNAPVVPRDGHLKLEDDSLVTRPAPLDLEYADDDGYDVGQYPQEPEEVLKRLNPNSAVQPLPEVRRPYFTADTDRPVFEDDHLLSLGMTWHLQRAMGFPFAERAAEYEDEVANKVAEDAGGARGFRLGNADDHWETWPLDTSGSGNTWIVS
jgi:hypothetical protein